MRGLRFVLRFIGVVQFFFGALFTFAPAAAGTILGLGPAAPGWAEWLFVMLGARFLGYGVGMLVAARNPDGNLAWINTMIGIQVVDWLATVGFLLAGDLPARSVASAVVLPMVFVAGLTWWHPRRLSAAARPVLG
jgi:hypothetical protein